MGDFVIPMGMCISRMCFCLLVQKDTYAIFTRIRSSRIKIKKLKGLMVYFTNTDKIKQY